MVNETPKTENRTPHTLKWILGALALVAVAAAGWMAYKNPTLFRAVLTGGGAQTVTETIYIPNNYTAAPGDSGQIEVKAGIAMKSLTALDFTFAYDPNKISITGDMTAAGDALDGKAKITVTNNPSSGSYRIAYSGLSSVPDIVLGTSTSTLFRLQVSILSTATSPVEVWGQSMGITAVNNTTPASPVPVVTPPTFRRGAIILTGGTSACTAQTCNAPNGACSFTLPVACVCKTGFRLPFCAECETGFAGPECKTDVFSVYSNLILTLATPDAIGKLVVDEQKKALSSVYVIFKSVVTDFGQKIKIGGVDYDLACSSSAANELAKLRECALAFAGNMEDPDIGPGVKASVVMDGVVKLEASGGIKNLVGTQTFTDQVLVVPGMAGTVVLDPKASYQTRVIGFEADATVPYEDVPKVKDLLFSETTLVPQPVNRLKSSGLTSGLLEKGDATGAGTVFAQIKKSSTAFINSNSIAFDFTSGPVIEYARVIGSGSVERGGRVNLSVKVSDVDTISDIQDISSSIVRSGKTTVVDINADATARWFTENKFVDVSKVTVTENVAVPAAATATATTTTTTTTTTTPSSTPSSAPVAKNYRIYSIPVEIPQDPLLTDGDYKLVLMITDKAGHENSTVIPLTIGKSASGDVNGDGKVDMLDVILATQIANGTLTSPTPAQLEAANLDGKSGVTMVDVVLLFNKVNKK